MKTQSKLVLTITMLVALLSGLLAGPTRVTAAGEWYAEYFNNMSLSGTPVRTRYESDVLHQWGKGGPGSGVPDDGFSARFTRDVWFEAGTYRFSYRSDDGMRIWVGNDLIVDSWKDQSATWQMVDHYVTGGVHRVRVEYYEHTGDATVQVEWQKLHGGAAWTGIYWNNMSLEGEAVLLRQDAAIDFDWGTGSPASEVSEDEFSARWSRTVGFEAGTYRFYASSDDGVRIYVDGRRILDAWKTQKLPNTHQADISLTQGNHVVTVEYFEDGGEAAVHVWWNRLDALRGWQGRYYDNRELRGGPALIRDDAEINFNWGEGAPVNWMPSDNFSVQWTRTINFKPGLYRFNAISDDGVRLWIDNVDLRLNHWEAQERTWHWQDWHYLEGLHTLRVEYFEKTGEATIQFWWDYAATVEAARTMPPSPTYGFITAPTPAAPQPGPMMGSPTATPGAPTSQLPGPWTGSYYRGRDLTQSPVMVRTDEAINFNWGWNAPTSELPANEFAVRWTGAFEFEEGRYRFTTTTDDGVRLYIDDQPVINSWRPMRGSRYTTVDLTAGEHTVRMEYFEATQAAKAKLTWQRLD